MDKIFFWHFYHYDNAFSKKVFSSYQQFLIDGRKKKVNPTFSPGTFPRFLCCCTIFNYSFALRLLELTEESDANKSVPRKRKQKSLEICEDKVGTSNQYRTVCLVPRPWRYIDGLLNRQVLEKMLETLIIHLKCYPNSTLDKIAEHFCPVLQPIMTLELLEMLESLRLVVRTVLVSEQACSLFSDFQNKSEILEDLNLVEGNETFTYYCKQKSIFTIKKIFQR